MKRNVAIAVLLFWLSTGALPSRLWAQAIKATPEIFKQFSEHVVKIEVVETGSAAKASVGTGFFASARGDIVTNYHVVSKLIHSADRYRVEVTEPSGQSSPA